MNIIKTFEQYTESLKAQFNHSLFENDGPHEFGCAMAYFGDIEPFAEMHSKIQEADLAADGIEKDPHVTLLYGLHSDEIEDDKVVSICSAGTYQPLKLHNVSLFENEDFDVLKFDVECEGLHATNKKLAELPHTNKYPDYHPHVTIAYLKPGLGKKYVEMFEGAELKIKPTDIVYSKPDSIKIKQAIDYDK